MLAPRQLLALAGCALACSGCARVAVPVVEYTAAEGVARDPAPRSVDSVEVLALGFPERAHAEVGRITAREDDDDQIERPALMQALRARAAELGCDAVVLVPPYEERLRVRFRHDYLTLTRPVYHGACIVYE